MALSARNQETLSRYYEHTNRGDFDGALELFADDAVYELPEASPTVPYAGKWTGKAGVAKVYAAFASAFAVVDMIELCSVSSDDELVSINDEIFVAKATAQPWRVTVAHQFAFRDGLITRLAVHLDLAAAHDALQGRAVPPVALPPVDAFLAAAPISNASMDGMVRTFIGARDWLPMLGSEATIYFPGDDRRLRFSGRWSGCASLQQAERYWRKSLDVTIEPVRILVEGGRAFATGRLQGTFLPTRTAVDQPFSILFQVGADGRFDQIVWYLNTYPMIALPSGSKNGELP